MHLQKIINSKRVAVEKSMQKTPLKILKDEAEDSPAPLDFKKALREKSGRALIAEIKRASPSRGLIYDEKNPESRGRLYEQAGTAAISVLTEEDYFKGSLEDLRRVKDSVSIPVLRKDFIIDPYQIYESRVHGADAILLIASVLDENQLALFMGKAREMGLCPLVEVHTAEELEIVLKIGADVVGINNRNLNTFQTDIGITLELAREVPRHVLLVSESGIKSREEILRLHRGGVDAFLIGETLMKHPSPVDKIKELLGEDHGKN